MSVSEGISCLDKTFRITDTTIAVGRIVKGDTVNSTNADACALAATADSDIALGVTLDATTADDTPIPIRMNGIALVECNGNSVNIAIGDRIVPTTAGVGIKATAADGTEAWAVGIALEPCTVDGALIEVWVNGPLSIGK